MLVSVQRKTLKRHKHTVLKLHAEIVLSLVFHMYQCVMWATGLDEWMNTSWVVSYMSSENSVLQCLKNVVVEQRSQDITYCMQGYSHAYADLKYKQ